MVICARCKTENNESSKFCCQCGNDLTKDEADHLEKERHPEQRVKRNKKIAIIATSIVCAIIAVVIVLNTVVIPPIYRSAFIEKYRNAKNGDTFSELRVRAGADVKYRNAKIGDTIFFGSYEQDNNTLNGKEKIEWRVLDKRSNKALLISKYALDCMSYQVHESFVTWEKCTLRNWLNNDFINTAFSAEEKALIFRVTVLADKNPEHDTNPGKVTNDRVFLLSIAEANKYFSSDDSRRCTPTDYAVACGAYNNNNNDNCRWWLRSPGDRVSKAACVESDGSDYKRGIFVKNEAGVRPAMWIKTS